MEDGIEVREDVAGGDARYWQIQLRLSEDDHKGWIERGRKVIDRYADDRDKKDKARRFNILWSNTETMRAALYARTARPDVRRRFLDKDQVGRNVALVIERALSYSNECEDIDAPIEAAVLDRLLPGRGVLWVEYDPTIETSKSLSLSVDDAGQLVTEEVEKEYIANQKVKTIWVAWDDVRHSPAASWKDLVSGGWVARRKKMTRAELRDDFPDVAEEIPLNWSPDHDDKSLTEDFKRAEVWEIWDADRRERLYVVKGFDKVLSRDDDPLHLEGFFPCPPFLQAVTTTDTLIPQPDFCIYQDQADELDKVNERIYKLTDAFRRRGVYDAGVEELKRLGTAGDNEFIPSQNFASLQAKGGLAGTFISEDLAPLAQALLQLYNNRAQIIQNIYEITGIADVMRGASDPRETLGAQQLKAQFGGNRIKKQQMAVQKFIRDLYRIKAEIMCEHFEPEVLSRMTGVEVTPDMIQVMRSDKLRTYRVDIETDSTVFEDAAQEKQDRMEFLTAAGAFLERAVVASQTAPQLATLAFEMLSFGVRGFKVGRQLEDVIERTATDITQSSQQPKPDPAADEANAKLQLEQAKAAQQVKLDQMRAAQDAQTDAQRLQVETELKRQEASMGYALERERLARDDDLARQEMLLENARAIEKARMDAAIQRERNAGNQGA